MGLRWAKKTHPKLQAQEIPNWGGSSERQRSQNQYESGKGNKEVIKDTLRKLGMDNQFQTTNALKIDKIQEKREKLHGILRGRPRCETRKAMHNQSMDKTYMPTNIKGVASIAKSRRKLLKQEVQHCVRPGRGKTANNRHHNHDNSRFKQIAAKW